MSNEIRGNVPTEEQLIGDLNASRGYDGKSAYELAVKHGYEGTEEEWVESLAEIHKGTEFVFVGGDAEPSTSALLVTDTEMSDTSENPVTNKVIKQYIDLNTETINNRISLMADYITKVEKNNSEVWEYRQWNSGLLEYYRKVFVGSNLTFDKVSDSLYASSELEFILPDNLFTDIWATQAVVFTSQQRYLGITIRSIDKNKITYVITSPWSTNTSCSAFFDIKGRWK